MDNMLRELNTIEHDQKQLESIERLQHAFNQVKETYAREYNDTLGHVITPVKEKLQKDDKMRSVVNNYVEKFVNEDKREIARDELYTILAADYVHTLQTLSHTSCVIS